MDEELVLGVTYEGGAGVQQFVNALEPLPGQIGAIMDRIANDGVADGALNADTGRKLARAVFNGWQSEMAGFEFFTGMKGAENVLDAAGLSKKQLEAAKVDVAQLRSLLDGLAKDGLSGLGASADSAFSKSTVMGFKDIDAAVQQSERFIKSYESSIASLSSRLSKLSQLDTTLAADGKFNIWNGSDPTAPNFGFSGAAVATARAAGVTLTDADIVRKSNGLPDEIATQRKFVESIDAAFGSLSTELRGLNELKRAYEAAPDRPRALASVQDSLSAPGGAYNLQAQAAFYQQATAEVAERRAGIAPDSKAKVSSSWSNHIQANPTAFGNEVEIDKRYRELINANGGANFDAEVARIRESSAGISLAMEEYARVVQTAKKQESAALRAGIESNAAEVREAGSRPVANAQGNLQRVQGASYNGGANGWDISQSSEERRRMSERMRSGEAFAPTREEQQSEMAARVRANVEASRLAREASNDQVAPLRLGRVQGVSSMESAEGFVGVVEKNIDAVSKFGDGVKQVGDSFKNAVIPADEIRERVAANKSEGPVVVGDSLREVSVGGASSTSASVEAGRREQNSMDGDQLARYRDGQWAGARSDFERGLDAESIRSQLERGLSGWVIDGLPKIDSGEWSLSNRDAERERRRDIILSNRGEVDSVRNAADRVVGHGSMSTLDHLGPNSELQRYSAELSKRNDAFGGAVPMNFRESFMAGFSGPENVATGEMVGQTARIALFYGAAYRGIAMVQQAIADVTAESFDYQAALTEMSVATNNSRTGISDLASEVGSIAASAGFGATAGVRVGSQTVGLWGMAGASVEEQRSTSVETTRVATQLARITPDSDLTATATQLVGTARAFEMGVHELTRIQDSTVYISRNTGQNSQQLLGATSNVATLGTSAGFSLEELMAIVAQVGTTTGQNPEGTAGQFRQVLSRDFETVAKRAADIFSIDTSDLSTVRDVLDRVASGPMSTEQLNEFSTVFGKGGSQSVAMITMQNWDRIQGLSTGASEASGIGEEAFQLAMRDIGQSISVMGAEWMELGLMITETGFLDWLALVVDGATTAAEALQVVVGAFNEIPRPLRSVAFAIAEFMLLSKGLQSTMGQNMIASLGAPGARAANAVQNAPSALATLFPTFTQGVRGAQGGIAALLSGAAPAGRWGSLVASAPVQRSVAVGRAGLAAAGGGSVMAGGVGVAAAALLVMDQWSRSADMAKLGIDALADAASQAASAVSSEDFRAAAVMAREGAAEARKGTLSELASGDVANLLPALLNHSGNSARADELTAAAEGYEARANEVAEREKYRVANDPSTVFDDFSVDGLAESMALLEEQGYSAAQRVGLLTDALERLGGAAEVDGDYSLNLSQFDEASAGVASGVTGLLGRESERLKGQLAAREAGDGSAVGTVAAMLNLDSLNPVEMFKRMDLNNQIKDVEAIDTPEVQEAVRAALLERLQSYGDQLALTDADVKSLGTLALAAMQDASGTDFSSLSEESRNAIENGVRGQVQRAMEPFSVEQIRKDASGILDGLMSNGQVIRESASIQGASDVNSAGAEVDYLTGTASRLENLRSQDLLTESDARRLDNVKILIEAKKRELVQLRLAEIDRLASVALSTVGSDDVTSQLEIRAKAIEEKMGVAQAEASRNSYYAGVSRGPVVLDQDQEMLDALKGEKFTNDRAMAENELAKLQAAMSNVSPGNSIAQAAAEYNSVMAAINSGIYAEGETQMLQLQASATQAAFGLNSAKVQGVNANALANIDPRNNLARTTQEIANARREMSLYATSDPRYGQLRDQVNQLQVQYLEGVANRANAMSSARIAGHSSSLEQAQVSVENAKRSLSTQLKGTEGYYNALASLRQAKAQLASEERAQADRGRRLGSDLTDPVEQARLDVAQAKAELNAAKKRGDGPDVVDQAKLDLRSAENAEEQAAFSQRLSDIQTAEDLGRITHSAYMQYLRSEHDRLSAIGDRTRQQQDQLDQVDKLMQSAAEELNGQFNIGDIDLPTVYDVRRAIGSGAPSSVADYSNSNNSIVVNGASFEQVVEYLQQFMGGASYTTQGSNRKV